MIGQDIRETALKLRQTIPFANLRHYDAAVASVAIELDADPDADSDLLLAWLWDRTKVMQSTVLDGVPPALAPYRGETAIERMDREYATAGYIIRRNG